MTDLPRVRWELTPVTAERVQEEFDQRIDLYVDISPLYANQTKKVLRDILAELTPLKETNDQGGTSLTEGASVSVSVPTSVAPHAAPELLEALKQVMGWIDNWDPNFAEDNDWNETAKPQILAAIAKAEAK